MNMVLTFRYNTSDIGSEFVSTACTPEVTNLDTAYLGLVHPMVVPRPPLSLSTASLSSSFLVALMSAFIT